MMLVAMLWSEVGGEKLKQNGQNVVKFVKIMVAFIFGQCVQPTEVCEVLVM